MGFFSFFKNKSSSTNHSPATQEYLQYFASPPNLKLSFRQCRFVVLDTETSGLNPKSDKILSIAALSLKNFHLDLENRLECYLAQSDYQPGADIKVHGILASQLQKGTNEKVALESLLLFVKNSILVGHHIGFDLAILNQKIYAHFGFKLKNKSLDTAQLAKRLENPLLEHYAIGPPASLDALCNRYSIPLGKRHTASGDAFITALLFMKLLARLERKKVSTVRELLKPF